MFLVTCGISQYPNAEQRLAEQSETSFSAKDDFPWVVVAAKEPFWE